MRVIGGTARGIRLVAPKGEKTRPTADRVKESLFNILGGRPDGAEVLDLYAGSGSLGIEALSRGASRAVFVEADRRCAGLIRENLRRAGLEERAEVLAARVPLPKPLRRRLGRYHLIFLDPPYERGEVARALRWIEEEELCAPGGWVVVERSAKEEIPSDLTKLVLLGDRAYGGTVISFLEAVRPSDATRVRGGG